MRKWHGARNLDVKLSTRRVESQLARVKQKKRTKPQCWLVRPVTLGYPISVLATFNSPNSDGLGDEYPALLQCRATRISAFGGLSIRVMFLGLMESGPYPN